METKTNIFFHAPKELTTDAFIVWLIYYLDSDEENKKYMQMFFDSLILKKEDCGRSVDSIELKRQENNVDVLLMFRFEDNGDRQTVLFEDKTWGMPRSGQLSGYKENYPSCYRYFYYKLGYINSQEKKEVSQAKYEVINAEMMSSTLEKMIDLHPLIKMYYDYITCTFVDAINSYYERIFVKHDYDILESADAQKYLCDAIVEKMTEQNVSYLEIRNGSSYGRPWTQIDFVRKEYGYSERLFWRVDIRSGKYYVRLNQYAEPSEKEVDYKMKRLEALRNEATNIVGTMPDLHVGKVENRAVKESEVLIFFLEDNNLERLLEAIPKISRHMIDTFQRLE
jgi:hypothetical protein